MSNVKTWLWPDTESNKPLVA